MEPTLKADIRIDVLHEMGVRLDDALEVASAEVAKREGAVSAVPAAVKSVRSLLTAAEAAQDMPLETKNSVIKWLLAAVRELENVNQQAVSLLMAARGAEAQAKAAVASAKALYDLEVVKKKRIMEPPAPPAPGETPHPAPRTLKETRLRERVLSEAVVPEEIKKPAKRGRKPKVVEVSEPPKKSRKGRKVI